jgi:hypothetical protein
MIVHDFILAMKCAWKPLEIFRFLFFVNVITQLSLIKIKIIKGETFCFQIFLQSEYHDTGISLPNNLLF